MATASNLSKKHVQALQWFLSNANNVVPWTGHLEDGTLLFTKAKGIYKPKESEYALSIRHEPSTHYLDQDPIFNKDGSWLYKYHQEEDSKRNKKASELYTNLGLIACMRDGVPVGVAIKINKKPNIQYKILGIAKVIDLKDGVFTLKSISKLDSSLPADGSLEKLINELESNPFNPTSVEDARNSIFRDIVQRQGQGKFRKNLLRIYNSKCAITNCSIKSVLEAAHITPYLGVKTNHVTNGLLLRADIHTLWDLGLIGIDPKTMRVVTSEILKGSEYENYNGQSIQLPTLDSEKPSALALEQQLRLINRKDK